MLEIENLQPAKMALTGEGVHRSLQDRSTPLLDVLVREAIQNSLDASVKKTGTTNDVVEMDFSIVESHNQNIASKFKGIDSILMKTYESRRIKSLVIKDKYTTGLLGEVTADGVETGTNFYNLVYSIMKPQQQLDAGGSYGLGKTIYYRIGIGLVIYYTRVFENGNYTEKLAACLIENEKKEKRTLPPENTTGIAWWGAKAENGGTKPILNPMEIKSLLREFAIEPYSGTDTGTTIIIPYIDEKTLLNVSSNAEENCSFKPVWQRELSKYLAVAIQRWYAPRLNNRAYAGSMLAVSINKERIVNDKMEPIFKIIKDMYNFALSGDKKKLKTEEHVVEQFVREEIAVNKISSPAGWVVFAKLSKEDVGEQHSTPYDFLFNCQLKDEADSGNRPILFFTRKPGMIVNYKVDGEWLRSVKTTLEDEYLIAFFVLNSKAHFKGDPSFLLEHYIRGSEKGDHMDWFDTEYNGKKANVLERIQRNVIKKLNDNFKDKTRNEGNFVNQQAGDNLANFLLPAANLGNSPMRGKDTKTKPTGTIPRKKQKTVFAPEYSNATFKRGVLSIPTKLTLLANKKIKIQLTVPSEGEDLDAKQWEDTENFGTKFPLSFRRIEIREYNLKTKVRFPKGNAVELPSNPVHSAYTSDDGETVITPIVSSAFKVFQEIEIENRSGEEKTFEIGFELHYAEQNVQAKLSMQEVGER